MTKTHIREQVAYPIVAFQDRLSAGEALRDYVHPTADPEALVFALPRGGIPVARPLADALGCDVRPLLVRKLHIPSNPEMGFGAVALDGTVTLNMPVVASFRIDDRTVQRVADEVLAELRRREAAYPRSWPLPDITGRRLWIVDDGLATGFSIIAAAKMLRAYEPATMELAVPVAPLEALGRLAPHVDEEWCLFAQAPGSFAVASFYEDFHDLSDVEVRTLLGAREAGSGEAGQ